MYFTIDLIFDDGDDLLDSIHGSHQNNETVKRYDKQVTLKAPTDCFLLKSILTNLKDEDGQYDAEDKNEKQSRDVNNKNSCGVIRMHFNEFLK